MENLKSLALIYGHLKTSKMSTETQFMDFLPLLSPIAVKLCDMGLKSHLGEIKKINALSRHLTSV